MKNVKNTKNIQDINNPSSPSIKLQKLIIPVAKISTIIKSMEYENPAKLIMAISLKELTEIKYITVNIWTK